MAHNHIHRPEAARRIVSINAALFRNMPNAKRKALVAEQREIWEEEFPGASYEAIERLSH